MSLEVNPVDVKCNLSCPYCYEEPMRKKGSFGGKLDVDEILLTLMEEKSQFSLFGGEPLLATMDTLERLFEYGFKRFKQNGVQTNGTLITDEHIELFKKYNVFVGFSSDGWGELSDSRWIKDLATTRINTEKTQANIKKCVKAGLGVAVIFTLWKGNVGKKLPDLLLWLDWLDKLEIKSARIHLLEVESEEIRNEMAPSNEQVIEALNAIDLWESRSKHLKFDKFTEYLRLLSDVKFNATCIWNSCDPLTTSAVQGIGPDGAKYNCGRTNKDGINYIKADTVGHERQLALYNTPQEYGGCKDCRFFIICKGECPGTGINGDWRNRTEHCEVIKDQLTRAENILLRLRMQPITLSKDLKTREQELLRKLVVNNQHQDIPHKDIPHGDHDDLSKLK